MTLYHVKQINLCPRVYKIDHKSASQLTVTMTYKMFKNTINNNGPWK